MSVEIVPAEDLAAELVLDAINASFDRPPRTLAWYRWKHLEGPWGPSRGWAAVEDGVVQGVRLFLPWRATAAGRAVEVLRASDGAVRPARRRQGLFSRLVAAEMERLEGSASDVVLYSTSVVASREAYRRLGWATFEVPHRVVLPRFSRLAVGRHSLAAVPSRPVSALVATDWTAEALRWRTDARSGHSYEVLCEGGSEGDHGVIVRPVGTGLRRSLILCHWWGQARVVRRVVGAAALTSRSLSVLSATNLPGCVALGRRGSSTVSVWTPGSAGLQTLSNPSAWEFSLADLEGVI